MRHGIKYFILATLTVLPWHRSVALESEFQINLPPLWRTVSKSESAHLFENTHSKGEYLYIGVTDVDRFDWPQYLSQNIRTVSSKRATALKTFGLYHYTIDQHQSRPNASKGFKTFNQLNSHFTGIAGDPFRSIERQFFFQKKLYLISYTKKTSDILNTTKVDDLLNRIHPKLPRRFPLSDFSETASNPSAGTTDCDRCEETAATPKLPEQIRMPGSAASSSDSLCKDVPASQRRKPDENTFGLDAAIDHCVADSTWLSKVAKTNRALSSGKTLTPQGSLVLPSLAMFYAMAKPFDHLVNFKKTANEVKTSVGSMASAFADNPKGYAKLLAINAYKGATQASEKYFKCYNRTVQMSKLCELMVEASAGAGSLKLGEKLLSGAKLTSEEAAAVKNILEKESKTSKDLKLASKPLRTPEQIEKLKALAKAKGLNVADLDFEGTSADSQLARKLSGADRFAPVVNTDLDELVRSNGFQDRGVYAAKVGTNSKGYDLWWEREKVPTSASTPLKIIEPYKNLPDSMKEREVFWQKNMQAATTPGSKAQFTIDQKEGVRIAVNRIKDCETCPMKDHSLEVMAWNPETNNYTPFVYKKVGEDWVLSKTFHGKNVGESCTTCHGYKGTLLPLAKEYLSESGRSRKQGFGDNTYQYFKDTAGNLLKAE